MKSIKLSGVKILIGNDDSCFKTTTVEQLKEKINQNSYLKNILENGRLKYGEFVLENEKKLSFYGIEDNAELEIEKHYDPFKHFGIKFTNAPDAILGDDTTGQLRAILSCGHAVDPNSLTQYCRSLIDAGRFKFVCPAIVDNQRLKRCNKEWNYTEVRQIALLNDNEMAFFERKLSELAAVEYVDYKECPKCRSFVERDDLSNLRVYCNLCKVLHKKAFEFCWQCEQEWTVSISKASDTCGRDDCINKGLDILRNAKYVTLDAVADLQPVPSIRACPTCGKLVEHDRTHCKNVICPRCHVEFCFACLETKVICIKTSSPYGPCSKPIAPIQTKIPIWKRK